MFTIIHASVILCVCVFVTALFFEKLFTGVAFKLLRSWIQDSKPACQKD